MPFKLNYPPSRSAFLVITASFSVGFCLFVYQAYHISGGLSATGHGLFFRVCCFTTISALSLGVHEYLLLPLLPTQQMAHQKGYWVLWHALEIFISGSLVFLCYNYFWQWNDLYLYSWLKLVLEYAGITALPIFGSHLYEKSLTPPPHPTQHIAIEASNGKTALSLLPKNLIFIKAEDNYVQVHFLLHGAISQKLVRNKLSSIEKALSNTSIKRCHRSFLINTQHIQLVEKVGTKLLVHLTEAEEPIPVSAKYKTHFESPLI